MNRATLVRGRAAAGTGGRQRRFQILARVAAVINSSLDPQQVLHLVLDEAVAITRATSGSVVLLDPHTQLLEIVAAVGLRPQALELRLPIGRGVTGWVAKTGRPLRVPDVRADPRYVPVRRNIRSELAVPLLVEDQLIGVLNVDATRARAFGADDEQLLVAVANLAARVIHNSWLYAAVAGKARQLESLFAVAEGLIASQDSEEILLRVVREACRLLPVKVASLMLLDADGQQLRLRACHGASPEYLQRPPLPVGESLVGVVVSRRKPVRVFDVRAHDAYHHTELARQEGLVSLLSVPMQLGETVLGVLNVYTGTPYRYNTQDVKVLEALGNLAAVAIANAQLHQKVVEVEEQLRRSERLSTLGLLAAEVAHEIRNPLTVMKMLFHSLDLQFPPGDPRARDTEVMAGKMEHLNTIVDQLLGYARSLEPRFELVDLNELVRDVLLLARHKLGRQNIRLQIQLAATLPRVRVDKGQIEQACLNLLLNATEAMPDGGGLTVTTRADQSAGVRVEFRDTGAGMTTEQQQKLFQPFLTTKARGTGLGLAIVQKIVETHRGRIEVESKPGRGSTFRLWLPAPG